MRRVYDAWRDNERYEDMNEYDKFLVDEYMAEELQEKADRAEEQRMRDEVWEEDEYDED